MNRKNIFGLVGWVLISLGGLFPSASDASVSVRNGNFFVAFTDIVYSGGFEPKIERVYNSKSSHKGFYGFGWGNEYEVYLVVSADGSVVVHEYGGGAENRFVPAAFRTDELTKAVDALTEVARKAGVAGTPAELQSYRSKLMNDATFRNEEWEKFRAQGKLKERVLAPGTKLYSNRFNYQMLTRVADGYTRSFETGKTEKFDERGKLIKVTDKNGNFLDFSYNGPKLSKVVDNFTRKIFFEFNDKGLISKIEGEDSTKGEYRYNDRSELVWSRDVDNHTYTYKYDKNHNLIEIGYVDGTKMSMSYWGRDQHESVRSVTEKDGSVTEYSYKGDPGSDHMSATIAIKGADGKQFSKTEHEYWMKRKVGGEEYTAQMRTRVDDGTPIVTTYTEIGLPLVIKQGDLESTFSYDAKGRVTKKTANSETTILEYDQSAGKVSHVTVYPKSAGMNPKAPGVKWSEFKYDDKANLVLAKNSEGKAAKLLYDRNGRISTIVDNTKRQVSFKYNENSKPIEIRVAGSGGVVLGTIVVTYKNKGEIDHVETIAAKSPGKSKKSDDESRQMALQVPILFRDVLDMIKLAGVSLDL